MKVLIDSRWKGNTGIGRLYDEVISRKPTIVSDQHITSNLPLGSLYSPLMLAQAIRQSSADIFYSPSYMPPLYSRIPYVITIHDLMHLFYYTPLHRLYYKQVIARLAKRAKTVITVSQFSKQQLVALLGLDEQQITVIYNGVDDRFASNQETFQLDRPYLLYIGNRRKNKNIPAMLQAFAQAKLPDEVIFALSGQPDEHLTREIKRLHIADRVQFLGFIPEENLPALYKGAIVTLYVSLMEGFGLPILESMASGTPVLTANTSALEEIADHAAYGVSPTDIAEIAHGIEALTMNGTLRQQYIDAGKRRASVFKWEDTAIHTWKTILS